MFVPVIYKETQKMKEAKGLIHPILTEAPPVARQETSLPETTASEAQPEETPSVPATSSTS